MDLINREAAIEAVRGLQIDPDSTQYIWSSDAIDAVRNAPTIPAVPLDKLCEWLAKWATWYVIDNYDNSDGWKAILTKWMEEQDATD